MKLHGFRPWGHHLTSVLLLMPWRADRHQVLGMRLAYDHQTGKALGQFDAALTYGPDWIQPRVNIAVVLLAEGRRKKPELSCAMRWHARRATPMRKR